VTARRVEVPNFPWLDTSKYSFSLGVEAAGATWLSGQTAAAYDDAAGRVAIRGDAGTQAAVCWDKVEAVLSGARHSLDNCSELVEYLTPEGLARREAVAAARPNPREASVIVVESLLRPEAQVEVEVVAGDAGGLVRLPQVLPLDHNGEVVSPGDLVAQAEFVLEEAGRRLAGHGLDLSHVVRTVEQTTAATRSDYAGTGSARKRLLGPLYPTSTGIISPRLPHPDALIALEVWASPHPKRVVNPGWAAFERFTFSPGVAAGELLFISGTTAFDAARGKNVHRGDITAQTEFVYEQIAAVCEACSASLANIIKTVEYITPSGMADYREVGALRKRLFSDPLPASTGVVVESLLHPSWMIEIEALAVLP
jgi:enamine deaminase RidA (YjgF/YER057c/UK114 family)